MRKKRFIGSIVVLIVALVLSEAAFAQAGQQAGAQKNQAAKSSQPVDPRDITGIWRPTGVLALSEAENRPPMTDWGKAEFAKTRSSWGRDQKLANGYYPDQTVWNDPVQWCDPAGYPRQLWWVSGGIGNFKIVQLPDEMVQFFERDHTWRDFWMDGRKLPNPDVAEPRWFGYAVAHWDGNTFVVNSNGYADSTWLDEYGSIHSDQMTIEERYQRLDHDHMQLVLTLTDPKTYTKPWVSDKKILNWQETSTRVPPDTWGKKPDGTPYKDIREEICVWSQSADFYKQQDAAGNGGKFGPQANK